MKPRLMSSMFFGAMFLVGPRVSVLVGADATANAPPAVVLQVKAVDELLSSVNTAAKNFLPEPMFRDYQMNISSKLDLKSLKGVDSKKPFGLYVAIGEGHLKGDLSKSFAVVLIPVTDEMAFIDLLGNAGLPPSKKGDAYTVPIPNFPNPASLRFVKGYAYIYFATATADPSRLLDAAELFSDKETAAATLRLRMDRVPDDMRKAFLVQLVENTKNDIQTFTKVASGADGSQAPDIVRAESALRTMRCFLRWINLSVNEGKELTFRVDLSPKTGLIESTMLLEPRSGSDLAKSIGALRPTKNDFTSIIGADSAGYVLVDAPLFIGEFKELLSAYTLLLGQATETNSKTDGRKELHDANSELYRALNRAVNEGNLNFAASMRGPDSNNQFTVVGAFSLNDSAAFEKALRIAAKKEADAIKTDVFRVQGINVHEIAVGEGLPAEAQKVFGINSAYIGLLPNAVFVTFGPQGKNLIAELLAGKVAPEPAPLARAEISGKRALALFKKLGAAPEAFQFIEKLTATERSTVMAIKVEGGDKLLLRVELGLPALWILSPKPAR